MCYGSQARMHVRREEGKKLGQSPLRYAVLTKSTNVAISATC